MLVLYPDTILATYSFDLYQRDRLFESLRDSAQHKGAAYQQEELPSTGSKNPCLPLQLSSLSRTPVGSDFLIRAADHNNNAWYRIL